MDNSFLNIPEFMWENIFVLLTTLVSGIIVAIFTSTFLKKKEERTRVSGVILEKRIESQRKMLSFFEKHLTKNQLICDDKIVKNCSKKFMESRNANIQYSAIFSSKTIFSKFYSEFEELFSENKLWLDEKVRNHLLLMNAYFSWINMIPIIISKIRLPNNKKITKEQIELACDKAVKFYGVILDNEINGLIAYLDEVVVNSIYKLNLASPKTGLKKKWYA